MYTYLIFPGNTFTDAWNIGTVQYQWTTYGGHIHISIYHAID